MSIAREKPAEITPERFSEITLAIEEELGRFMVGQRDLIRLTLASRFVSSLQSPLVGPVF